MGALLQDLVRSVRSLRKNPLLTVVALTVLALGIGANAAIFSVMRALLLNPLPFKDAAQLVVPATVFKRSNSDRGSIAYADMLDWRGQTQLFAGVAAYDLTNVNITGGEQPERVRAALVTEDYFKVITSPPLIGRIFRDDEKLAPANRVVILSYRFWMRRFGGDPKILDRTLEFAGVPHMVIGVMPRGAIWPQEAELIRPLGFGPNPPAWVLRRDNHIWQAIARLQPGVPIQQAQAVLTGMAAQVEQANPVTRKGTGWKLHPILDFMIGPQLKGSLLVLVAAVAFVLAIACVNLANLLLARATSRKREFAIRSALGAGRIRLIREQLAETLVLALAGGGIGLAVAWWGVRALVRFGPAGTPRLGDAQLDFGAVAFTFLLSLGTAVVIGLLPALKSANSDPVDSFRDGGRTATGSVRGVRLRGSLVVAELALSIVLLVGAGLLIRTFRNLQQVNPGFQTANMITFEIGLPRSRYQQRPQVAAAYAGILESIRGIPGVAAASSSGALPIGGGGFYLGRAFLVEGRPEPPAGRESNAAWDTVQPNWFQTMGIPLRQGRAFTDRDIQGSNPVMIISESMAKDMFPGENALGKRVRSWRDENVYREVVGVAGDAPYYELTDRESRVVYVPHAQDSWSAQVIAVRARGNPAGLLASIKAAVWERDKNVPVANVQTMDEILAQATALPRFLMFLLGVFATVALLLASVGIYGVMSYAVAHRTHEIGIRLALGAQIGQVWRNVMGRGAALVALGIAAGAAGAVALTRLMSGLLFGVTARDPLTFCGSAVFLALIALAACWAPARRATRVDPIVTLRYQ